VAGRRFALILFEAFSLAALFLAATGIYVVLSGTGTGRFDNSAATRSATASRVDPVPLLAVATFLPGRAAPVASSHGNRLRASESRPYAPANAAVYQDFSGALSLICSAVES